MNGFDHAIRIVNQPDALKLTATKGRTAKRLDLHSAKLLALEILSMAKELDLTCDHKLFLQSVVSGQLASEAAYLSVREFYARHNVAELAWTQARSYPNNHALGA